MSTQPHIYRLEGLSCTNCAAKFEKNIKEIPSVEDLQLNFGASKLTVTGNVTIEQLEKAGAFDGIRVYEESYRPELGEKRSFWSSRENRATVSSFVFLLAALFIEFGTAAPGWVPIVFYVAAIAIGGFSLFRTGLANLIRFEFDMKTLMTIAIIGAAIIGEWQEGAVVVLLFALSEALEGYSMDKARQSIRSLMNIAPNSATVRRGTELATLDVNDIQIGDTMLVKPGQKIAMDGIVAVGESSINEAAITGESMPKHKQIGDAVFAGSLNEEGFLEVTVTKRVQDTTIAKIIHLVEEAQAEKAPSQQFVDRFAAFYTPAILLVALLVATLPPLAFSGDWSEWIYRGLTVLVVGCPCALVVSTPVAIVTAIGNAAKNGVLIKGGVYLEELGRIQAIAFDKTGTLSEGRPAVTDVITFHSYTTEQVIALAAGIEQFSQHPLASAIVRYATDQTIAPVATTGFRSLTGRGAYAEVDGQQVKIGSPALFGEHEELSQSLCETILSLQQDGKTVVVLGSEDKIYALLAVADPVREVSASTISRLKAMGMQRLVMLTGDNAVTAQAINRKLGLDTVEANLLPEQKLEKIRALQKDHGSVAMVGDGVNDAPALASATVGIAMGGAGTDTALETADVALLADDLTKLPYTMELSRKTLTIIKQNIGFALALKVIALLLIIPGWLTLWMAVLADVGSTVLVVLNSMRLLRVKE
ncbi:heavy metal translocating P-type ATPase [Chryseomicrobium sp. FSL W7-1435]|uniref:heavy metal translocating P-type ATPase n=1 Tax=Chryseomicrobium sp. FSL W7-1435 TaxID=2921704 RepID=UPI00315AC02A